MFGFKKSVTAAQFGEGVLYFAHDYIHQDALRSLGARFENYDASKGWLPVFQANGVPIEIVKLYGLFYTHVVLQTHFKTFSLTHRQAMTRGAMANLADKPPEYDFAKIFNGLEDAFNDHYNFDPSVASLRNQDLGSSSVVYAAKYLINSFILGNMKNAQAYVKDFHGYSSTVGATVGTVNRATQQVLAKAKVID